MSLAMLDVNVLVNPPRLQQLAYMVQAATTVALDDHRPLTPTSNSLEEQPSDTSDHEGAETGPSSIEDHARETCESPRNIFKLQIPDSDDAPGVLSSRRTESQAHATSKHKKEHALSDTIPMVSLSDPNVMSACDVSNVSGDSVSSTTAGVTGTAGHNVTSPSTIGNNVTSTTSTGNNVTSPSTTGHNATSPSTTTGHNVTIAPAVPTTSGGSVLPVAPLSPSSNGQTPPARGLLLRRHTDSTLPTVSKSSFSKDNSLAHDIPEATSLRRKFSHDDYAQSKARTYTDLRLQTKMSVADSEFARMRSSVKRRSTLRRRDYFDGDNIQLGNKIDEGHRNYVMAYNMLTGIRVAVSSCSGVMKQLSDKDFRSTKKLTFNNDGNELTPSSKYDFKFKDYCPEVFRELRSLFGIDPADYLMSITGKYILSELGSPGKSGSFFYYSRDFRFIIKTIHHAEHKQLRRILKSYYSHVKENPNTLISQFYGLHRLKVKGSMKKIHFIVMNNLFPPHRDIHIKYDLKGSTWGRYTRTNEKDKVEKDISEYTLKDLNWLERGDKIKFGPAKQKIFLKQLEADVDFLKKINVMDYSLLLGVHDVKKGNSLTTAKLSVYEPKSSLRADLFKTNPRDIDRCVDLPSSVFPGRSKYIFYGHDGGIRATDEMGEPLPEIYYLGIIDCLTNYSFKKRLETFWRSLSHTRSTISAVPAKHYGDRFLSFIKKGLATDKLKSS